MFNYVEEKKKKVTSSSLVNKYNEIAHHYYFSARFEQINSRDVHELEYRSQLRQEFQCFSRCRMRNHKFPVVAGARDVQESESEQEPESSKFFRSRIGLGVKFNVKTGVGAEVTICLSYYCNVH